MKLLFKKGKQRELILSAKNKLSWKELADKLDVNENYLARDLKYEKILLSNKVYIDLCKLSNVNFDKFIIDKFRDNWGQKKGGLNSSGTLKKIPEVKFDEKLAEFVGVVLGDGHIEFYKKGKRVGVYAVRIAGDLEKDKDYHINYLKNLGVSLFNIIPSEIIRDKPHHKERFLDLRSKELVKFFGDMGIKAGDKIKNQSTIPKWIFDDKLFLRACLRGLIDTDGCICRMSKKNPNLLRINFVNHNYTLLKDTRRAFILVGFNPSKIISNRQFFLSRQKEISKYLKEIGFSNKKHIDRFKSFKVP